ncbi:hypothetical protein LSM04_005548 [Trypanosoma melophagium]|uniref:uncharacterized protein n=1 Tax=Trypanosoma melophagium TaxID=715481 RepID=UPI00351A88EA|nr:hypothetical protein LSM04_005548 [Trypanosoma melophagium]
MKSNNAGEMELRHRLPDDQRWDFLEQIYTNYEEVNAQQQEIAERRRELKEERFQGNKDNIHNLLFAEAAQAEPSRFGDWETYEMVQGVLNRFVYSRSHDGLKSTAAEEALYERIDILTNTCTEQKERIESLETSLAAVQEELAGLMHILQMKENELKNIKTQSLVKDLKVSQLQRICDSMQDSAPVDEKAICRDMRVLMDVNKSMEKENMRLRAALDVHSYAYAEHAGYAEAFSRQTTSSSFPANSSERLKRISYSTRQDKDGKGRSGDAPSQQKSTGTTSKSAKKNELSKRADSPTLTEMQNDDSTTVSSTKGNVIRNSSFASRSRKTLLNDGGELAERRKEDSTLVACNGPNRNYDASSHLSVSSERSKFSNRKDSEGLSQTKNLFNIDSRRKYIREQLPITHMHIRLREERELWRRRLEAEVANTSSLLDFDANIISSLKPGSATIGTSRTNLKRGSAFSSVTSLTKWSEYRFGGSFQSKRASQGESILPDANDQAKVTLDSEVSSLNKSYDNKLKRRESMENLKNEQVQELKNNKSQDTELQEETLSSTSLSRAISLKDSETTNQGRTSAGTNVRAKEMNRNKASKLHEQGGGRKILTKVLQQPSSRTGDKSEKVAAVESSSTPSYSSIANSSDKHKSGNIVSRDALTAESHQIGENSGFRRRLYVVKNEMMKLREDQKIIQNVLNELFRMLQEGFNALQDQCDNIQYSISEENKVLVSQVVADVVNDMVQQTVFDRLEEQGIFLQRHPGPSSSLTDEEWAQNQLYDAIVNSCREQVTTSILKDHGEHEKEDGEAREKKKKKKNKRMGEEGNEGKEEINNNEMEMSKHDEARRDPGRPLLYHGPSEKSLDRQRGVASLVREVNSLGGREREAGVGLGKKIAEQVRSSHTPHITGGGAMNEKYKYEKTSATLSNHTSREGKEFTNSKNNDPISVTTLSGGYTYASKALEGDSLTGNYVYSDEGGNFVTWKGPGNNNDVEDNESIDPSGGGGGFGIRFGDEKGLDGKWRQTHMNVLKSTNPYGNTAFANPFDHQSLGVYPQYSQSPAISPKRFKGNILEYLKAIRRREKPEGVENMAPVVYRYDFKGALEEARNEVRNRIRWAASRLRGNSFERFFNYNILPYANTAKSLQSGQPMAPWMASAIRHLRSVEESRNRRATRLLFQRVATNLRTRRLLNSQICKGSAMASYLTLLWKKWTERWYKKRETIRREGAADIHRMLDIIVTKMKSASRQQQRLGEQMRLEEERRRKNLQEMRYPCVDPSSAHFDVAQLPKKYM